MQTIVLFPSEWADGAAMHRTLKLVLDLPDHYGNNADALYDCLSERVQPLRVIVMNDPQEGAKQAFDVCLHVLEDVGAEVVQFEES